MGVTLGTYLEEKIRAAIDGAIQDSQSTLEAIAKEAGGNVNVNLGGSVGSLVDLLTSTIVTAILGVDVLGPAGPLIAAGETAAGPLGTGFGIGYFLAQIGFQLASPALNPLEYLVNRTLIDGQIAVPARIDAATAAAMWAKGIMQPGEATSEAADIGFDLNRLTQLRDLAVAYPDLGAVFDLRRRGWIADTDVNAALAHAGYTAPFQTYMPKLEQVLLSPADLALNVLRGFNTQTVGETYVAQVGLSAADFQILIDNTGEPPGLEELLFMYRLGIIQKSSPNPGDPTLENGIRESRVRNEWIPALEAFRLRPMSVADAIRARVENYWTDADAQPVTEQNGLDPAHYPILVEAYGRPLSLGEMSELYHRGLATEDDVKNAIRQSDIKDAYIEAGFQLTKRLITERYIDLGVEFGAFTVDQAIDDLMALGYIQTDAELIVDLGQQQHHRIQKDLTAADVTASYTDKLMTLEEAKDALTRIGYKPDVAQAYLDLADFKYQATLAKQSQTAVKALFLKSDISREEAIDKLVAGGSLRDQALALVDEWELTRGIPSRHLTEAQIVKAAEDGIINAVLAANMLVGIGYTESDATTLLQIAGLVTYQSVFQGGFTAVDPQTLFGTTGPGIGAGTIDTTPTTTTTSTTPVVDKGFVPPHP